MFTNLSLYIIIAVLFSILAAAFQYIHKNNNKSNTKIVLFVLRFFSVFLLILLLINPKIKKNEIEIIKPNLVVFTDNTKSISTLKQETTARSIINKIKSNKELNNKFNLDFYTFSDDISFSDSLTFNQNNTNIYKSLQSLDKLYKNKIAPVLLITDGNQTFGNKYSNIKLKQSVYPIIVGDTAVFKDVLIIKLNVNKYAYLKNKFPVEVFVNYKGKATITTKLTILKGKTTVFTKMIKLDSENSAKKIDLFLKANSIGIHNYSVKISPLENEKNTINNKKNFVVEVLNEQSKILIVSDILHPDIAMLKRSIESNKQRKVFISKPTKVSNFFDYQLVILYQPTVNFKNVFEKINTTNKNIFIITGTQTDWNYLNSAQLYFKKKVIKNKEYYSPIYNTAFTTFLTNDIGFENFSPLNDFFGKVNFSLSYQSILFQQVNGVNTNNPLLATFEHDNKRVALLLGEKSWRWRMSSKIESNSFQSFDDFFGKIIQYLASNKKADHLEVLYKDNYYQNETIVINAKYYDANFIFNPNMKLWITIKNKQTKKEVKYPFASFNNNYKVTISNLESGQYSFTVFTETSNNVFNGSFSVLEYNIEEQFTNANKKDLLILAKSTKGQVTYPDNLQILVKSLIENTSYVSIQKSKEIITPLINWRWILGIITLLLSIEWFIRKYKGYI